MTHRMILIALGLICLSSFTSAFTFTGNAANDFSLTSANLNDRQKHSYFKFNNTDELVCSDWMRGDHPRYFQGALVPNPFATIQPQYRRSGMDIDAIHMMYDDLTDRLYVGIQCGGICGDADGDGNPSAVDPKASAYPQAELNNDLPNMCGDELMTMPIWTQVPATYTPTTASAFYPNMIVGLSNSMCLVENNGNTGLFAWEFIRANQSAANGCTWNPALPASGQSAACKAVGSASSVAGSGFGTRKINDLPARPGKTVIPALNIDPTKSLYLNDTYRHIEFYLQDFSNYPRNEFKPNQFTDPIRGDKPFRIAVQAKAAATDGCGEDIVVNQVWTINWDCANYPNGNHTFDVCGECDGPGLKCRDCHGTVNGSGVEDACGECDGDNSTCTDCAGILFGNTTYDDCGICGGDNSNCTDCLGVLFGNATYDECGVCDGNNTICADCWGVPNGNGTVDECGICDGDNTDCADCRGTPNGGVGYDVCGECGGPGLKCLDCQGTPNGTVFPDVCGVCGGDGILRCLDCQGTPNGTVFPDACGVCGGDGVLRCLDCEGTPNGTVVLDLCEVCGGDNTSCAVCDGVPNGNATYDDCGVCNGDGSTCICYKYLGWEAPELCHSLLRWSIAASRVKLQDTLDILYTIKNELPYLDYKSETGALLPNYLDNIHEFCDECLDNFDYAQAWFADRLAGNCKGAHCEDLDIDTESFQL